MEALRSIGLRIGYIALSTISAILLARVLGPSEYGRYAFAIATANLLVIIVQLGLPTLLVRDLSIYVARNQWSSIRGLLRRSNQIVFVGGTLVTIGVAIPIVLISPAADSNLVALFFATPLVLLLSLGNIRGAALRGLHHVLLGQLPEQILRPLFLAVGTLTLLSIHENREFTANLAVLLNISAAFAAFAFGAVTLWAYLPGQVKLAPSKYDTRRWATSVIPLTFVASLNVIHSQASLVMLGAISPPAEAGIFSVAMQGALFVNFTAPALDMALGPRISKLYSLRDFVTLQQAITWSARLVFFSALPIFIIQVAAGKPLIGAIFGKEYADVFPVLLILAAGKLVTTATGSVGLILAMSGNERMLVIGSGIGVAVNLILNVAMIPTFGAVGAATATSLGTIVWYLVLAYAVKRRTGLTSHPFITAGKVA